MAEKIQIQTNPAAANVILKLTKIALQAHSTNASPVDIKLSLADLPADMLMQIEEDVTRVLEPYKPYKNEQQNCPEGN